MTSLFLLVPMALLIVAGAVAALMWAVNDGQFDSLDEISRQMPDQEDER